MIAETRKLFKNIYRFYRHDCRWPYSLAFYLVLLIYWVEAVWIQNPSKWASILSYFFLLIYYLHLRKLRKAGRLGEKRNLSFFLSFLTAKVVLWGILLARVATLA